MPSKWDKRYHEEMMMTANLNKLEALQNQTLLENKIKMIPTTLRTIVSCLDGKEEVVVRRELVVDGCVFIGLEYDNSGSVIGYVVKNNIACDFNNNFIGNVDKNNDVLDEDGNIIGHVKNQAKLVYDEKENIIGYADEQNHVFDKSGKITAYADEEGHAVDKLSQIIGTIGDKYRLVYNKEGNVGRVYTTDKSGKEIELKLKDSSKKKVAEDVIAKRLDEVAKNLNKQPKEKEAAPTEQEPSKSKVRKTQVAPEITELVKNRGRHSSSGK